MKLPLYNMKDIKFSVETQRELLEKPVGDIFLGTTGKRIIEKYGELNEDTYLRNFIETNIYPQTKENTKKILRSLSIYRDFDIMMDDYTIKVLNKLIGDTKLHDKLVLTRDGSYLNNRIFINYEEEEYRTSISLCGIGTDEYESYHDLYNDLSAVEKIDWLYNHYDKIFIHFNIINDYSNFIRNLEIDNGIYF